MYLAHVWGQVLELEEKPAIQDWTEVPGCWQNPPFTSDLRQTESAYQCTKPTEFRTNNNRTGCALLCLAALSRPALCDPINCSPPRLLCPLEFPRQEYWSGLPCPPPGDLLSPGLEPVSLMSPALAGGFFITSTSWEGHLSFTIINFFVKNGCWNPKLSV